MNNSRIDLLENAPVKTAIIKLALPTMLAMAVQLIYNLTDLFFIGKTGDPRLIAAISLASPIMMIIQAIGNIFATGTSSYISRVMGAKKYDEAKRANSVAFYTMFFSGLAITVLLYVIRGPLLSVIGTSSDTINPTSDYFTIITAFSIASIFQIGLSGLVRSEGATTHAMKGMVIGIGLNIILDPIFILVLHKGTAGAALATGIGNSVGAIYFIAYFLSKKSILSIKMSDFKPSKIIYSETFKIGIPAALSSLAMSISMILVNVLAVAYGDYVVAGNGIHMRVMSMCIMLIMGLAQGFQPFAGYNFGSKAYHRLKEGFLITLLYSTLLALFFTLVFGFFGNALIGFFIDDAQTIQAGTQILHAFNWCVPFLGIQLTMMVTFQATGMALKAMIVSLGRQCLIYLPLLFILNAFFGFSGFIYAQPIADITTTIISVLMSISFLKDLNEKNKIEIKKNKSLPI
jgi:putative MATE family efflux protein